MLLTINIGNSSIRFGLFHNNNNYNLKCNCSWIINSNPHRSLDEYILLFRNIYQQYGIFSQLIQNIVIGSVVPPLTNIVEQSLYEIHKIKPIIVDRDSVSPIKHYSHQLGTDLYANAIAAYTLYNNQNTTLVVDFGTALSLTCIDKYGKLKGVIIAPGVNSSLTALIGNTAQLSQIELKKPPSILGQHTETCIQSGIIYGYLSMVEGLIDKVNKELKTNCFVIATGGLSHIYTPLTKKIHLKDKLHTIKGLKILFHWNH
ncbi:pantothenate kinase/putatative Baf family transcriptional activator [Blattabacterium sp. (Blattella germanica) str. Bge]|uniref:type III pantothenate kinase n=1 Tax=Blattabacterium sp. (Blattella germanica) TaxID=624186 RepID=UPI0001BB60D9|nr:type III pantothenate kinase [Blattabacterium sp. (Blattella germanica)]ACY40163.1 pantothenate kinase/putatative Baf family transcriptional activator [Blattabacterium sp. (Blattella germanica) str. Bge]